MHTHMHTCATFTCTIHKYTHTHVLQHVCAILHVKSGDEIVSCITDMMKTIESRQHLDKVLLVHILDPSEHDHSYRDWVPKIDDWFCCCIYPNHYHIAFDGSVRHSLPSQSPEDVGGGFPPQALQSWHVVWVHLGACGSDTARVAETSDRLAGIEWS